MHHTNHHTGAALLIFLTVFVLGISALLLSALNQQDQWSLEEDTETTKALAQAKEALMGYAVSFGDDSLGNYGFLPCPDVDNSASWPEGVSHGNGCGERNKSSLGRFPWRTLGLPPLRDGAGECLWYAVSGDYKGASTARTKMLNEDSNGLFKVFASDGTTLQTAQLTGDSPENLAVAVIIAPGKMLPKPNQNRTPESSGGVEICGGNYSAENYLETDVNHFGDTFDITDAIKEFLTAQDTLAQDFNKSHPINDKIAYITREEIWEAIRKRSDFYKTMKCFTQITANCVAVYANTNTNFTTGDKRLPWAAPMDLGDYRDDTQYDDDNTFLAGRLPNIVGDSNTQIGKTVPNYLVVDPDSGDPTPPTECNFSAIQSSELTDCQTFFKRITSCNPNSINPNDKIWCDEGQVTTAERSDATFNYAYFYSTAVNNRCSQEVPVPPLTSAEETQCTTIKQIKNSNRAIKTFRPLWNNWKDHLFYAVANAYKPGATLPIPSCDNTNCLRFTKTHPTTGAVTEQKCAAVVIFAGKRLANQNARNVAPPPVNDPDMKKDFRNYLEGDNATHGNGRYQQLSISDQFNDIVYCIKGE